MIELYSTNGSRLETLRKLLFETLVPLIDEDYSLLDVPNHGNIGDSLITLGELELLKKVPYRLLYKASVDFCRESRIPSTGILLFNGGGNFGDLWSGSNDFRRRIIKERTAQKIIIFSQSVYYSNEEYLKIDIECFNSHPNLIICARDNASYLFLKKNFRNNVILLLPDMAFCLDMSNYKFPNKTEKLLFLKREDKETRIDDVLFLKNIQEVDKELNIDITDWPTMNGKMARNKIWVIFTCYFQKLFLNVIREIPLLNTIVNDSFGFEDKNKNQKLGLIGVKFYSNYDVIYSTRLHGVLLALLLNKKVICFDNSYGKNSSFYNTWLADFDNCTMIQRSEIDL